MFGSRLRKKTRLPLPIAAIGLALFLLLREGGVVRAAGIPFDVPAPSALLMDVETGQILYGKNVEERYPPASLSKLMTLLLVFEALDAGRAQLTDTVRTSERAAQMGGSQVWLTPGETHSLEKMIEAIAIASANDATVAVAEYLAGTESAFVTAMDRRAEELGLKNTHFVNSTGLPENGKDQNYTTAADVARLARELLLSHPQVLQYTSVWHRPFRESPPLNLTNTNRLIQLYPGADGLKTGHTEEAGWHLVATAERNGRRLLAVVLRAGSDAERVEQTIRLLDYGFNSFQPVIVVREGESLGKVPVAGGSVEQVEVRAARDLEVLAPRLGANVVDRRVVPKAGLTAPLSAGDEVGVAIVTFEGQELGRVPVVAAASVPEAGPLTRFFRWVRGLFGG